ncbi:hypothetical protein [Candidatus Poriferisodalis sp.]|uniref:hypothetical protein n=1 Tax=Candidatus Poriferisodalis sp. TaxID=3101277 RepID=UPI003B59FED9
MNPVLAFLRGTDEPIPMDPLGLNATNDAFNVESNPVISGKHHLTQIGCSTNGTCQG